MAKQFYTASSRARLSDVLVAEAELGLSRKTVVVAAGVGADRALNLGAVLGRRLFSAPVIAAKQGGNTGNGALGSFIRRDGCKVGTYTLTCIAAAANGGRFEVLDPDGYRLGDALVGVAYVNPQIGLTVSDGSVDFVAGDGFTVTIDCGDLKVVGLDPAATDGTQLADSVLITHTTAPVGSDIIGQAVDKRAVIADKGMVWPEGISSPAKAAAIDRLSANLDIIETA